MTTSNFGVWDYLIMGATALTSIGIGVYFRFTGGRQKTNEEYLHGDRNLSVFPIAVSLVASFLSSITLLGLCSEIYSTGIIFTLANIGYTLATPIITELYLPVFYKLKTTSTYEYLELRFGPNLRLLASLTYTLQMMLYNGIVLYAPAIVLETITGMNRSISIVVMGAIVTFYSTLGGIKAVVWTDLMQTFIMYGAMLSVTIFASIEVGGFSKIFEAAYDGGRINYLNFSMDPTVRYSWFSIIVGSLFIYLSVNAVNHTQVQRIQTVSTVYKAKLSVWASLPVLQIINLTTCVSGLAIYSVYKTCDPYTSGKITSVDQILPHYVVDVIVKVPGLAGLFLAGIMCASLSTLSASCNALTAVTISDYLKKVCTPSTFIVKVIACLYGLSFLAIAFLAEYLGGIFQAALTIFGIVGGPLLGVFSLGLFTTYANENGAIVSLITSIGLTSWMAFGRPRPPVEYLPFDVSGCDDDVVIRNITSNDDYFILYKISYLFTSVIGFLCVVIVGSVVSLLWKKKHPWELNGDVTPDPDLFTPLLAERLKRRQLEKKNVK